MSAAAAPSDKQRAAYAAGQAAFAHGFDSTVCPYDLLGEDTERLGLLWTRGYAMARTAAGAPFGSGGEARPEPGLAAVTMGEGA